MDELWFKGEYIWPIISGAKTHTNRKPTRINLARSGLCFASLGPRRPFAALEISSSLLTRIADLPKGEQREVKKLYPAEVAVARITFATVAIFDVPEVRHVLEGALDKGTTAMDRETARAILAAIRPPPVPARDSSAT